MRRALMALLVPEGVLLLVAAVALAWPEPIDAAGTLLRWLPAAVLVAGLVLALRFEHSGVLFGLVALTLAGAALAWGDAAVAAARSSGALRPAVALLLPVNLVAFALLPEPGLFSGRTARRATALALQAAVLTLLARPDQQGALGRLAARALSGGFLPRGAPAGDVALALGIGGVALLAVRLVRRPDPLTRAFLWALAASMIALASGPGREVGGLGAVAFLLSIAGLSLVVGVIETAYALAYRDGLTGLPSRRAFDDALRRLDGAVAIAMVDVDRFKSVNDTHGHDVGDQVLRMVAAQMHDLEAGRAYRYGGEEFALVFPGGTAAGTMPALESLRSGVEAASFTVRGADRPRRRPQTPRPRKSATRLVVTVSIGVAHRPDGTVPAHEVVAAADAALYRAKRSGRNRIETARALQQG